MWSQLVAVFIYIAKDKIVLPIENLVAVLGTSHFQEFAVEMQYI